MRTLTPSRLIFTLLLVASWPLSPNTSAQQRGVGLNNSTATGAGRYYALIIGNNNYISLPKLNTAESDAREIDRLLRESYGFQTKLLLNATRAQIIAALSGYRRELRPDANLLIYYAGHGYNDKETDKAYWLPVDATIDDVSNWIIADEITTGIKAIPAKHVLIISDSCYSGMLTRGIGDALPRPTEREQFLQRMAAGRSRTLIASGGNEPVADNGGGGHSVFAAALLRGLREMDKGQFTAAELYNSYVLEAVAGQAQQTPVYALLQNSGHESGDFVFTQVSFKAKTVEVTPSRAAPSAPMKASDIVRQYGSAVVKIDVAWRLVSQEENKLVYHQYMMLEGRPRACYVRLSDGSIEPLLTLNSNPLNVGIGGQHTGSGFLVSADGFILTNRHVAAPWHSNYRFPPSADNGVLVGIGSDGKSTIVDLVPRAPTNWVPVRSKQNKISYEGRDDYLNVLLPNSEQRLLARLTSFSLQHDAALIKVDSPSPLPTVELNDNYDTIEAGDVAVVLGYPTPSNGVYGIVHSQNEAQPVDPSVMELPAPVVLVGNVGRVYRSQASAGGGEKTVISVFGDMYQLQLNATESGSAGAPVFDDHGSVIGIFYGSVPDLNGTPMSFAVPIRFGRVLMGETK